eukprot:TRINITY_DN38303_c0_g1_i1.p1 TRINITY_DN38303_c0_g1~~TRINITY_DN38303_c0_g1_i1.p1  ORF type:complete len:582 (+),score=148.54 TRINITY_DN38303_c0_g1_i1:141-1748(+)
MYQPVCGSDGKTYNNLCLLQLAACMADVTIDAVSGTCEEKKVSTTEDWFSDPWDMTTEENIFGFEQATFPTATLLPEPQPSCQMRCKKLFLPVCGSNGKTYTNACLLDLDACRRNEDIEVLYEGDCEETVDTYDNDVNYDGRESNIQLIETSTEMIQDKTTEFQGSYTNADYTDPWIEVSTARTILESEEIGGGSVTLCRTVCTMEFSPVCGSDGNTYNNFCLMEVSACQLGIVLSAVYDGSCLERVTEEMKTTTDQIQILTEDTMMTTEEIQTEDLNMMCPEMCPAVYQPVCGSDNVTYSSACHLRQAECRGMMVIIVQHAGACEETGLEERCPSDCPTDYRPVCGSDGVTYDNPCRMQEADCRSDRGVSLNYEGSCTRCHPMLEWMCGDTSCVNTTTLCDGINDCPDATDESFCSFICFDGSEISLEKNCDGIPNCPDGEDENNCLPFLAYTEGPVCDPLDQYQCKEGVCISIEKVCDGVMDCMFEDDEFDCTDDKIGRYSYTYEETMDPVVYDTEYDQVEDEEEDWAFGLWR